MKEQWRHILKRIAIGGIVFLISLLPWKKWMLSIKFVDKNVDFAWVILSFLVPYLWRAFAMGVITAALFFAIKTLVFPRHLLEKEMFGIRKKRFIKNIFYVALFILPFLFPIKSTETMKEVIENIITIKYFGRWLSLPFLPFSWMRISLFFESLLPAFFLIHLLKLVAIKYGEVIPLTKKKIFEEGKPVEFGFLLKTPLALLPLPQTAYKINTHLKSDFLKKHIEVHFKEKMKMGYYRFDILKFSVATFPFFFSTAFKTTRDPIGITVIPRITQKNAVYSKNPYIIRDTGDLIKKVSGSSMEFAGIKEYQVGDPTSRIWWKSLAKGTRLMTKDFYSPAEDRWLLIIDLSNPQISKEQENAILSFSRAFIEIFTRKDVEIEIHLLSSMYSFIPFTTNKRALLSFLVKHWSEFRHISEKGAKAVLKEAVGKDVEKIGQRCKESGISYSAFLFYSGLIKNPKRFFQWSRKFALESSLREMVENITKSAKAVVLTPQMDKDMADDVKKFLSIKKCKTTFVSFQKVPFSPTFIMPKKQPEKIAWRLMYV